jgi:hypothetical protein
MNGSKHCITSKNKTTLYLVSKEVPCLKVAFFFIMSAHKTRCIFQMSKYCLLVGQHSNIQIWIDLLSADMTKKDTFKQGTSLCTV